MLLIGIDEAGYGPKLGPLCHGFCALRVSGLRQAGPPDIWSLLASAVSRHPALPGCIAVDDSKKIHGGADGLNRLRLGVAAFLDCLPAARGRQGDRDDLWAQLLPEQDRCCLEADCWGAPVLLAPQVVVAEKLPTGQDKPPLGVGLAEALSSAESAVLAVGARAQSVRQYNAALQACDNKADVSWAVVIELLTQLVQLAVPQEDIYAVIDRQGGRKFYAARLSDAFKGILAVVESEQTAQSSYRLTLPQNDLRVSFLVEGDGSSLPVALGSMAAKLVRELYMERFNAFFQRHLPELRPTAGYAADATRFLRETAGLCQKLGIEQDALVRVK